MPARAHTHSGDRGVGQPKSPAAWFWGLAAAGLVLDQASKVAVFAGVGLPPHGATGPTVIPGFFFITPRYNPGMAWSLFSSLGRAMPAFLVVLNAAIVALVVLYRERWSVVQAGRRVFDLAMGMVIAGALGNLIDRLHPPFCVMDFLHFRFFGWDYPVFNAADIYIVVGVGVFVFWSWRLEKKAA